MAERVRSAAGYALLISVLMIGPVGNSTGGIGQDSVEVRAEAFALFNNCQPMRLLVEGLGDDAKQIGLTEARLVSAVESRLRSARLYVEDHPLAAMLYINVNVVGPAYNINVEYQKLVMDAFGNAGIATTWYTGGLGTHGRDSSYVVAGLSEYLDRFLVAYLRVNAPACP